MSKPDRDMEGQGSTDGEAWLDRLVRDARSKSSGIPDRPPPETLAAYIAGRATAAQRRRVRAVLEISPEFRRELLEMTTEYNAWRVRKSDIGGGRDGASGSRSEDVAFRSGAKVSLLHTVVVGLVTVAAMALLYFWPTHSAWILVSKAAEPTMLMPLPMRGTIAGLMARKFDDPEEAAFAAFRHVVTVDADSIEVHRPMAVDTGGPGIEILLRADDGALLGQYRAPIPSDARLAAFQLWTLTLPGLSVYRTFVSSMTSDVPWDKRLGPWFCVAAVYRADSTYRVLPPEIYTIDSTQVGAR